MPKVTNFVFCEPGQFKPGSSHIPFIEGVSTSSSLFGFAILYSITSFSRFEDHNVFLSIKDPHKEELIKTEEFTIEKSEDISGDLSRELQSKELLNGATMAIEFDDVEYRGQGLYAVEVFFDGELLGEFFLPVILRKESEK